MNDDYLWDKTGEPDPQIQQLEEILGTLRYQPRPLPLPVTRRRSYFPVLAIAATVLIALLGTGLWLRVHTNNQPAQKQQAHVPAPSPTIVEKDSTTIANTPEKVDPPRKQRRNRSNQSALSAAKRREREEAIAVKQQLMLALRLASEKLNLAHKKARIG
ncbi:MAG TPA: hypothetical protein VFY60_12535 [Pyrinomonadaceae bacterium]|nr:hypothetical protein [Pyrinomonadaceae bacterium]